MKNYEAYHICIVTILASVEYMYAKDYLMFCYYTSAARNRTSTARFIVRNIDFTLCSHYVFSHANVDYTTRNIVPVEPADEGSSGLYMQLNNNKLTYRSIKTLLSVGSAHTANHEAYELIMQNDVIIGAFARNAAAFLRYRKFDGMVVDWPTAYDKDKLVDFLKLMMEVFTDDAGTSRSPRLLLAIMVPGITSKAVRGFDGERIARYVDFVILATYDMVVPNTPYATFSSPLYGMTNPVVTPDLSVNDTVRYYDNDGVPYNIMILGIRAAGRYVRLRSRQNYTPGSGITNEILYGGVHSYPSIMTYPEVCLMRSSGTRYFDNVQKNPYLVVGDYWVGYEDTVSLAFKMGLLQAKGMMGTMFYSMDEDDVSGTICGEGRYPLLKYIKSQSVLSVSRPPTAGTIRPVPTAPRPQSSTVPTSPTTQTPGSPWQDTSSSSYSPDNTLNTTHAVTDNPDLTTSAFNTEDNGTFTMAEMAISLMLILLAVAALCLIICVLLLRLRKEPSAREEEGLPTGRPDFGE